MANEQRTFVNSWRVDKGEVEPIHELIVLYVRKGFYFRIMERKLLNLVILA